MKKDRKVIAGIMAMAMFASLLPADSQAAASKPKLSQKSIQIRVGESKTVKIMNANKIKRLKISLSKKNAKKVAVKKSGKKALVVKGKKVGTAKVNVIFSLDGKKISKTLKITVKKKRKISDKKPSSTPSKQTLMPETSSTPASSKAPTVIPSIAPTAGETAIPTVAPTIKSTAKPTVNPTVNPTVEPTAVVTVTPVPTPSEPTATPVSLDLSKFDIQQTSGGAPTYDSTTGYLTVKDVEQFIVNLPQDVNTGESLNVTIRGINKGTAGFRCWLSDTGFANLSNNEKSVDHGVESNDFVMSVDLLSTGAASQILIKGPSYGTPMDDLVITAIEVTYSGEINTTEPAQPYQPKEEQAYNTESLSLTKSVREMNTASSERVDSMLVSQRFIADPTTIEYNGRLYVYGTTDEIEFDGKANVISNGYNTHTLSCISTEDMVNWRDEGQIDVTKITSYAQKSWAPSIVSKEVGGKTKFFLYYTTGGDGIAMLEADSPTGPWTDPIGDRIIDRKNPNCSSEQVPWLFDPGVFVDDDGQAYIYFGGGDTADETNPSYGRIAKLSEDMTSLAEEPKEFGPYYYFEDNEINKFGDTYYYSYSTNWSSDLANNKDSYTGQACIAYYTADNPYMKNATYHGTVFANPGNLYGHVYNNHHHMFTFKGESYIAYHTTFLERALYGTKQGYRNLHIDKLTVEKNGDLSAEATYSGIQAKATLNAMVTNLANTMSDNGGVKTEYSSSQQAMVLSQINTGDWSKVSGADFGTGAAELEMKLCSATSEGSVEVYVDGKPGEETAKKIATLNLKATSGEDTYESIKVRTSEKISGVHDLYFVYRGKGYQVASWSFLAE